MIATVHTLRPRTGPAVSPRTLDDASLAAERGRLLVAYQDSEDGSATERASWRWFGALHAETERRGRTAA